MSKGKRSKRQGGRRGGPGTAAMDILVAAHSRERANELGMMFREWGARTKTALVGSNGLQALLDHDADVVVIDAGSRTAATIRFISEIRKMSPWTGFVVIAAEVNPGFDGELVKFGALENKVTGDDPATMLQAVADEAAKQRKHVLKQADISVGRLLKEQEFLKEITRSGMHTSTFVDAMRDAGSALGEILPIDAIAVLDLAGTPALKFFPVREVTWGFLGNMDRDLRQRYRALTDGGELPDPIEWHVNRGMVRSRGRSVVNTCYTVPVMSKGRLGSLLSLAAAEENAFSDIDIAFLYRAAHQLATVLAGFDELRERALRDGLTGLYNRQYLEEQLSSWRRQSIRDGMPLGVILMDLDQLKPLNDTYGHLVGDDVLREFGDIIRQTARDADSVSRYGGDEVAVLVHNATLTETHALAMRLVTAVRSHVFCAGRLDLHVTTSCGATSVSPGQARALSTRDMIGRADKALYRAKMEGRDRAATWPVAEQESPKGAKSRTTEQRIAAAVRSGVMTTLSAILRELGQFEGLHWSRTREMALVLGRALGMSGDALQELGDGVFLHDVGKLALPPGLFERPGPFTDAERQLVREHPEKGAAILKAFPFFRGAAEIVQQHQEWYDGKGYPNGLAGDDIALGARICSVADAYDAIRSDRPHRPRRSRQEAVAELDKNKGTQFDPRVVDVFLDNIDEIEEIGKWED